MRAWLALASAAACVQFATPAWAQDPFEIQVYDGTANKPGEAGLELHLNHIASGTKTSDSSELPTNHQTHATLEPSLGILPWWEIGMYFQTSLRQDGTFDYAGTKLRSKFVTPPGWSAHFRLGANVELAYLPATYDRNRWGAELRPIAAWSGCDFRFAVNPIVGFSLAGDGWSAGPTFEPAASAMRDVAEKVGFGLEYYGSIGAIASPDAPRDQHHYLFEVFELLAVPSFELNVGVGEGLTPASNGLVFKMIVGYSWEPAQGPRAHRAARLPPAWHF